MTGPPTKMTRDRGTLVFFVAAFVVLLARNADRLLDPPYWDALIGVFQQGVWLKDNAFDFVRLSQMTFAGSPKLYLFNLAAPAIGLALGFLAPSTVFLLMHVLTIACAAATAALFFRILSARHSVEESCLWTLAAAVDPTWSGQCAGLSLEVPVAACVALSLYCFSTRRFGAAALVCAAGYFVKISALLLAAAYFAYALLSLWTGRESAPTNRQRVLLALPLPLLLALERTAKYGMSAAADLSTRMRENLFVMSATTPSLLVLMALCLPALLFAVLRRAKGGSLPLLLSLFIGGFFASFLAYHAPLARYSAMVVFPLMLAAALTLSGRRGWSLACAAAVVSYGLMNQHGRLLPRLPTRNARDGHYLERSREYLADLDADRRLSRFLEEGYFDRPIVCKYPFVHMLTLPEMGYVSRALPNVYAAGRFPVGTRARPLAANPEVLRSDRTVFIHASNVYEMTESPPLMPGRDSRLLFDDRAMRGFLVAFTNP